MPHSREFYSWLHSFGQSSIIGDERKRRSRMMIMNRSFGIASSFRAIQVQVVRGVIVMAIVTSRQTVPHKGILYRLLMEVPCHRISERCHHINGKAMPICARCLAMLSGFLFVPLFLFLHIPFVFALLMQVPMLIDGITQRKGWRVSTNPIRSITGLVSGLGLAVGITAIFRFIIQFAV